MEDTKRRDDFDITEVGEIFFFYRPKVDAKSPHSVDEVQRLYMVLRPVTTDSKNNTEVKQDSHCEKIKEHADEAKEQVDGEKEAREIKSTVKVDQKQDGTAPAGGEKKQDSGKEMDAKDAAQLREEVKNEPAGEQGREEVDLKKQQLMRLIIIGKKVLPDPSTKTRPTWCFVDFVTTSIKAMKDALSPVEYDTKTRGHRVQPGARPAAEGVYCILRHKPRQKHTHLVYKLDKPAEESEGPKDAFRIEKEASYILSVKNPEASAPPNAGLGNKRKATFPAKLQGLMGSYRFVAAHPPDYLNYEGCEFILAPASDDVGKELDMEIEAEEYDSKLCADLAAMVDMESDVVRKPLFEGEWA